MISQASENGGHAQVNSQISSLDDSAAFPLDFSQNNRAIGVLIVVEPILRQVILSGLSLEELNSSNLNSVMCPALTRGGGRPSEEGRYRFIGE